MSLKIFSLFFYKNTSDYYNVGIYFKQKINYLEKLYISSNFKFFIKPEFPLGQIPIKISQNLITVHCIIFLRFL